MLSYPPTVVSIPLQMDSTGTIRVSGTRVTLDTVIGRHLLGDTPEAIQRSFDVLSLNDVYAVITFYLANREMLDAYLRRRADEGERLRQEIEASYTPEQRERNAQLHARMEEKRRARIFLRACKAAIVSARNYRVASEFC